VAVLLGAREGVDGSRDVPALSGALGEKLTRKLISQAWRQAMRARQGLGVSVAAWGKGMGLPPFVTDHRKIEQRWGSHRARRSPKNVFLSNLALPAEFPHVPLNGNAYSGRSQPVCVLSRTGRRACASYARKAIFYA